jgi:hypothetical protein
MDDLSIATSPRFWLLGGQDPATSTAPEVFGEAANFGVVGWWQRGRKDPTGVNTISAGSQLSARVRASRMDSVHVSTAKTRRNGGGRADHDQKLRVLRQNVRGAASGPPQAVLQDRVFARREDRRADGRQVIGTDAAGRPYVWCCGVVAELAAGDVQHHAWLWLSRHNVKQHPGRHVPQPIPVRMFGGLVPWF